MLNPNDNDRQRSRVPPFKIAREQMSIHGDYLPREDVDSVHNADGKPRDPRALSRRAKVFTPCEGRVYTGDLFMYCIDLKLLATCVNYC
jgi:hypothetical protein